MSGCVSVPLLIEGWGDSITKKTVYWGRFYERSKSIDDCVVLPSTTVLIGREYR